MIWAKLEEFWHFFEKMDNFCQILTIFGKFTKMRKTPNKWAVMRPNMKPKILTRHLETDNLGSQKSQNALKTGGRAKRKEGENRRQLE